MKKSLLILCAMVLTIACCFKSSEMVDGYIEGVYRHYNKQPVIVIDAGHGGIDVGTVGIDGSFEKNINLDIALCLYDYLSVNGISARLVRQDDSELYLPGEERNRSDLYNRLDFVNSIDNSILVSIHQNHYENEAEWGTQIWYSPNDSFSNALADGVLASVNSKLEPNNKRQNKMSDDSYYILYKASVPSIMIECGFMSNREECSKLQQIEYQKSFAYSVLAGLYGEL